MDKKEEYCSECLKRCSSHRPNPENPIESIGRIWSLILSFGAEWYQRQEYSMCCDSKVIYLSIKERILLEL